MKTLSMGLALALAIPLAVQAQESKTRAPRAPTTRASPETEAALEDIQATFGTVPAFLKAYPPAALPGAWAEMKALQLNPKTELSGREKELIGLAVAAQIPCSYCVYFHTKAARANGATDEEISEAIATSASARHWSTVFHGARFDRAAAQALDAAMVDHEKKAKVSCSPPPPPGPAKDAAAVKAEMLATFGTVPDFVQKFPAAALPGAWQNLKDLDFSADGALSPRQKSLISVAVGSQIPCDSCLALDLPAAERAGATQEEISEAVGMAALTRLWSTVLNGIRQDEVAFRKEADRMFAYVAQKQAMATNKVTGR